MSIKDHRIYKYMSEPVRMVGLTMDEIALFIICFFLFFVLDHIFYKMLFLLIGTLGVYLIKRFKKMASGFSLNSYLHWQLGIRFNLSDSWPQSWKRFWLP